MLNIYHLDVVYVHTLWYFGNSTLAKGSVGEPLLRVLQC
jgi:hypothetical protein